MIDLKALNQIDMSIAGLHKHYENSDFSPEELIFSIRKHIEVEKDNPVFIYLLKEEELKAYLQAIKNRSSELPLYGIPFAIKDNIDLAGVPSTAACPDFSYTPKENSHVVQCLIDAGAIPIGKTNMDQFATGLVGTRSPWGACKNSLNSDYISGGSSAGSAVSVAKAWVSFSLGTDTAGSGRVPASLNNIVGLKPSCGLLSNTGVIPACKSIDCVTIFALSATDANSVLNIAAHYDSLDPYSRQNPYDNGPRYSITENTVNTVGIPSQSSLEFFGNKEARELFTKGVEKIRSLGIEVLEIDFSSFLAAARLLYEGPWVVERYLTMQDLLSSSPESVLPVIRRIVEGSEQTKASETFLTSYQLNLLKQQALAELEKVDCIVTPTNGTIYTIDEVNNDPIQLNSNLGYYTNFMNLLDFSAVSVPTGFYECGVGFGLTLFAKAFQDKKLLALANEIQKNNGYNLGSSKLKHAALSSSLPNASTFIDVAVCGAHLESFPLNWQLTERGASKVCSTFSAKAYRLYALAGGPPYRPGMVRDENNGEKIKLEVWRIPKENFGSFVAEIPHPLGIAKLELENGAWVSGFSCEAYILDSAKDITHYGGWADYIRDRSN